MKTIPFTYLIGWSKHNVWYYGRRTKKKCQPSDLWKTYFTSSNHVKQFRLENGEPDIIIIRKTFTDTNKCSLWETKVLRRIDAAHNEKWLNRKNGDEKWNMTGVQHSEETKRKIGQSNKGKLLGNKNALGSKHTDEWKEQQSLRKIGKLGPNKGRKFSKEICDNISNSLKGRIFSDEHKQKLKESAKNRSKPIIECPHCGKSGWIVNMNRYHFNNCKNKS